MKRSEMIAAMEDRGETWDVIIIGGGATGLGAAVEASSRGHRTVLVEADDFAKGTSSRSTKLIHGGVRYLRQGQISMVRHSLQERQRLLQNAPHIVHSLNFVLPTYRVGSRTFYYAGLRLYDMLAGQIVDGRTRRLSRSETSHHLPTLKTDGLRGGVLYSDGQFDDARLAITLARTAVDHGAAIANYLPVISLIQEGSRVRGVIVRDTLSGHEISLRARVVLNATGVFAEDILRMDFNALDRTNRAGQNHSAEQNRNINARPTVAPSQGSHLVLDSSFLPGSTAMMIPETDDGRVLFAIPWHEKVLLGTTDVVVKNVSREPRPMASEIEYLLEHAGRYLQRRPKESDVVSRFAGLRPLVQAKSAGKSTSQLSREHLIHTSDSGLITVIGGKWTTYRQMGEELIDRAESTGDLIRRKSQTAKLKLHGCPDDMTISTTSDSFTGVYGTDLHEIEQLIEARPELAQRLHPQMAYRAADVVWAVRHEMAQTVEDVLARRTRALFLDAQAAIDAAPAVAKLMATENHKDETWRLEQIRSFRELANGTYATILTDDQRV